MLEFPFAAMAKGKLQNHKRIQIAMWKSRCMSQPGTYRRRSTVVFLVVLAVIAMFVLISNSDFVLEPRTSPANACINNLREIDAAKNEWMLKHNAKTNDTVTLD